MEREDPYGKVHIEMFVVDLRGKGGKWGQVAHFMMTTQLGGHSLPRSAALVLTLKHSFLNYFHQNVGQTYKSRRYLVESQCIL